MTEIGPTGEQLRSRESDFWAGSELSKKLDRQHELGIDPPHVLITDRDGTHSVFGWSFQGTEDELEAHNVETRRLNDHLAERGTVLIMNTGGSIEMMEAGLEDGTIPADAALVAGGSEFWVVKDGRYVRDEGYQDYIENVIGYRREHLYSVSQEFIGDANASADAPADFRIEFQPRDSEANVDAWDRYAQDPQPENKPTDVQVPQQNKISFYVYGGDQGIQFAREQLESSLDRLGLGRLKVVYSADTYEQGRYLMDLLPVTKKEAAESVIELLTREYGEVLAAVAGDAQNDTEVILGSGVAGIAVGNRQQDLEQAIEEAPATRETKHFKIVDGRLIYRDDTNYSVAASLYRAVRALEKADVLIKNR